MKLEEGVVEKVNELMIMGDRSKLGQIFRNLTFNALKFTPKGGHVLLKAAELTPIITAASDAVGLSAKSVVAPEVLSQCTHWLTIHVTDSGAGISQVCARTAMGPVKIRLLATVSHFKPQAMYCYV